MSALRDSLRVLEHSKEPGFVVWLDARRCYFNGAARLANPMLLGESGSRFDRASPLVQELVRGLEAGVAAARALRLELGGRDYVGVPLFGIDGAVDGWIVRAGELADAPLIYRALQADASLLSQIAHLLPLILFTVRPSGERDFVNRAFVDYSGLLLGGGTRVALEGLVHDDDASGIPTPWREGQKAGELFTAELRLRRMDGAFRWHALRLTAVRSRGGAVIKWIGTLLDIDDRRAAEATIAAVNEQLDARVEELERVLDVVPIGIAIANGFESDEVRLNRALMEMLGEREPYVPYGHPSFRYLRAVDLDQTMPGEEGGTVPLENDDGTTRLVEVSAMPLRALDGNGGVVAAYVDVTRERRRALRRAMVSAALRTLACANGTAEIAAGIARASEGYVDGIAFERVSGERVERLHAGGDVPPVSPAAPEGLSESRREIVVTLGGPASGRLVVSRAPRSEPFESEDLEAFLDIACVAVMALQRTQRAERDGDT